MTKKIIGLVAVAVTIAILAGGLYFLNQAPPIEDLSASSTPAAETVYVLGNAESGAAKEVKAANEKGGYTVRVEHGADNTTQYILDGYEGFPVRSIALSPIAQNAGKLSAKSVVAEGGADLSVYGLDAPSATVDITGDDGTNASLKIGDAAPGSEGYYVMGAGDAVYLVSSSFITPFLSGPFDFMETAVSGGDPAATVFGDVRLSGTVREEPIVIKKNPPAEEGEMVVTTHSITQPVTADLDAGRGAEAIATAFGITADSVAGSASTDEELEAFGLKEPYSSITVIPDAPVTEPGVEADPAAGLDPFTINAGAPDEDGNVYVMNGESSLVYQCAASSLGWLETQVFDLMSRLAILPHIDAVSNVTVEVAQTGKQYVFALTGEGDEASATYNGTGLNMDYFRQFYQSLIGAALDNVATEPMPDGAELLLKYTYEYKDSAKPADVVEFYAGPPRLAYIVLNGGAPFYTPSTYLDRIYKDVELVAAGQEVESYL